MLWRVKAISAGASSERSMVKSTQLALSDAAEWLGQWHPLAEQLGSADGLLTFDTGSAILEIAPVHDFESLRSFLEHYHNRILLSFELPAIYSAHGHAERNELRELIALDQRLVNERILKQFAGASRRIGQTQLQKLRPLRDLRFLQRYLQAVEGGQAHGWHTLVYGVTLAIYSLPLRQGILGYAHQVTRGFIYAAAHSLHLSERDCRVIFDTLCKNLPEAVEALVRQEAAA